MRLSNCFMELIAYVAYFLKTAETKQPPYDTVKAEIDRLISAGLQSCREGNFPQDEYEMARFAVFAWIDEMILRSEWNDKNRWLGEQLQRIHYQTTDAGELFYDRLNAVGLHQQDVREVYYLCLCMGFTGRHCHSGDDFLLDQLKSSNLRLLSGSSAGVPSLERGTLFPEAYAETSGEAPLRKKGVEFSLFTLGCGAFPLVLFLFLFVIYRFVLHNLGDNLFTMVP